MTVFVDTSAIFAMLDRGDANHAQALRSWTRLCEGSARLVTNNYILVETTAVLQRRLGMAAVRAFHQDIVPLLEIHWVSETQHSPAMEAMLSAARRKLSLVDCISFQTIRGHGIQTVFCFDSHFAEQGFDLTP